MRVRRHDHGVQLTVVGEVARDQAEQTGHRPPVLQRRLELQGVGVLTKVGRQGNGGRAGGRAEGSARGRRPGGRARGAGSGHPRLEPRPAVVVAATRKQIDVRVAVKVGEGEERAVEQAEADSRRHVAQNRAGPHVRVDGQSQGDVLHRRRVCPSGARPAARGEAGPNWTKPNGRGLLRRAVRITGASVACA
eukprot:scaffold3050_cov99-Isochrysis_galbana.AAC.2